MRHRSLMMVLAFCGALVLLALAGASGCTSSTTGTASNSGQPTQKTAIPSATTSSAATSPAAASSAPSSSTTSPSAGGAESVAITLDLGPADTIKLSEAWSQIGEVGGFEADTASPDTLALYFSPSGSLVHLLIVARTDAGDAVTVSWDGLEGRADQRVAVTGEVVKTVATLPCRPDRVATFLAAIDEASPARMVAQLRPGRPGGYCEVMPIFNRFGSGGGFPAGLSASIWDGSAFAPLPENDPRRSDSGSYVYFMTYALVPESVSSDSTSDSTTTTVTWNVGDFANLVIPMPGGLSSTATQTTLAPSAGRLLFFEEQDLASATVVLHTPGQDPTEFAIDLTDASKRTQLVALLNGLEKLDQLGNPQLFPVSLEVILTDGQECDVLWYEDQPLELVTATNSLDERVRSTVVESPEMSAFLAGYLQYQR